MRFIYLFSALMLLAACGEEAFVASAPWKETDKKLTCEQLQLEMNDARYWQGVAEGKKKMKVMDVLWLPGYFGTVQNANEAIGATTARLNYLGNIYKIKKCDNPYQQVQ
jgi:hypothetical protein